MALTPAAIAKFEDGDPSENPWVAGKPLAEAVEIEAYSEEWPKRFKSSRQAIAQALGDVALHIEHIGSTAVPGLPAKPVIDIDLIVDDPDREDRYVPALAALGYVLTVRERTWYRHRMLRLKTPHINLHVFGPECPEHLRHVLFRDWLRDHPDDCARYAQAKSAAKLGVDTVADYNHNKQSVVRDVYRRIFEHHGWV